jgi:hypothetical protein
VIYNPKDPLEKQADQCRQRLASSKSWRDSEKYDETWNRLKDLYALKHYEGFSAQDRVAVAVSFATINVIGPSISVNKPKTTVLARKPEDNSKAIIAEAVLDWLWETGDVGDEFRRAVKDFLVVGHGWVKTGWRLRQKMVDRPTDEIDAEFAELVGQIEESALADPEMAGAMPTDDEIMAGISTSKMVTVEDRVFVERVSPHDMFVDPNATSLNDACWIAQRLVRPASEVRADKTYEPKARKAIKADLEARWGENRAKRKPDQSESQDQMVTLWEFYDLKSKTVCVFADQGKGFLVKPTPIPYKIGHPFVMLRNYDVPDAFYPIGDLEAIEPLQHELNRTRNQLMQTRDQFSRKLLYRAEAFGPEGRQALEAKGDSMVPVVAGIDSLNDLVYALPVNNIPGDLFNYSQQLENDVNTVSGVSDYQRGASPEIRRTATEASMIQDAVNARSADKLAIIEKAIAQIGKNMMGLCRQYMTGPQVARIVGAQGLPIWVPFSRENIDADMDFTVEGGSTMPKNEAWRQNQAMQLMNTLTPLMESGVVNVVEVVKYVMTAFGVKTPEKFIQEPPPMMGGPPGMPPGMVPPGMGAPPEAEPPAPEADDPAMTEPGMGAVPPEILAQLEGQLPNGLTLPTMGLA